MVTRGTRARAVSAVAVVVVAFAFATSAPAAVRHGAARAPRKLDPTASAAAKVLGYLPLDQRYTCDVVDSVTPDVVGDLIAAQAASVKVVVKCDPGSDEVSPLVTYVQLTDAAALDRLYTAYIGDSASQTARSDAGSCPSDGTWDFDGTTAGRSGCYFVPADATRPEYPVRVWTSTDTLLFGVISGMSTDTDGSALHAWWKKDAAPLDTTPERVSNLASGTPTQDARAVRRILDAVPKRDRDNCQHINLSTSRQRLYVQGALYCTAPDQPGLSVVSYYALSPAISERFFVPYLRVDQAQGAECPGSGHVITGKGANKRRTGAYTCFKDDSGNAQLTYIDYRLGIMVNAYRTDGNFDELIRWWNEDAAL